MCNLHSDYLLFRRFKINVANYIGQVRLDYSKIPEGFKPDSGIGAVAAVLNTMGCGDSIVIKRPVNFNGTAMSWDCLRAAVNKVKERRVFKLSRNKSHADQFLIVRVV
jgi:hypothetical protein